MEKRYLEGANDSLLVLIIMFHQKKFKKGLFWPGIEHFSPKNIIFAENRDILSEIISNSVSNHLNTPG